MLDALLAAARPWLAPAFTAWGVPVTGIEILAFVLAMAVPYMGFVDMRGHDWRGNTVVFGLAVLSVDR